MTSMVKDVWRIHKERLLQSQAVNRQLFRKECTNKTSYDWYQSRKCCKSSQPVVKEESVEGKYTEIKWRRWLSEALTHSALNNTGDKENIIAMPEGCIM